VAFEATGANQALIFIFRFFSNCISVKIIFFFFQTSAPLKSAKSESLFLTTNAWSHP